MEFFVSPALYRIQLGPLVQGQQTMYMVLLLQKCKACACKCPWDFDFFFSLVVLGYATAQIIFTCLATACARCVSVVGAHSHI